MKTLRLAFAIFLALTGINHAQTIAIEIDDGMVGNQEFTGPLGMDFIVVDAITVTELGAFDSGQDGFLFPITVELWSREDDFGIEILASAMFDGEDGELQGGSRFLPLDEPIALTDGAYTIVAYGYDAGEPNGNDGGVGNFPSTINDGGGAIEFVGGSRFGDPGSQDFPASVDGGPANRYGAGTFIFTTEDSDNDGMPDVYEMQFGLDPEDPADAVTDLDNDGLNNLGEFNLGTLPNNADTDGDTLNDGVETGTGVWVSAGDTGTDPLNADTDNDALSDGVETNTNIFVSATDTGTNPHLEDTDMDQASDGLEVASGFNPVDANSTPSQEVPGQVVFIIEEGALGTQAFGGPLGMDFILNEAIRVLTLGAFDDGSDGFNLDITVELWTRDDGHPEDVSDDAGLEILAMDEFTSGDPGALLGGSRFRLLPTPILLEPGAYSIVAHGYGGGEQNGNTGGPGSEIVDTEVLQFIGGSRFGAAGTGGTFPGTVDGGPENRYAAGNFTFDQGNGKVFQITDIQINGGGSIDLTWASTPGKTYAVSFSDDLIDWIELEDGLDSDGDETSFEITDIPEGTLEQYYRIREEQ